MSDVSKNSDETVSLVTEVAGVILAGGKSSRYGRNKALETIEGVRLIERVVRILEVTFAHLVIVTNTPQDYSYLGLTMVEDRIKGLGPIGGIHTGLESIEEDAAFFAACDMPFLNRALIHHMLDSMHDFDAVIPRLGWRMQTLHALYHKRCLPYIRELIERGEYQVFRFFPKVHIRYVDEEEIRAFDPDLRSFFNVNRPEELQEATDFSVSPDHPRTG
jgi:molybdopterin-guanine dinucleotide biosynthesis protein A